MSTGLCAWVPGACKVHGTYRLHSRVHRDCRVYRASRGNISDRRLLPCSSRVGCVVITYTLSERLLSEGLQS